MSAAAMTKQRGKSGAAVTGSGEILAEAATATRARRRGGERRAGEGETARAGRGSEGGEGGAGAGCDGGDGGRAVRW